RRRDTRPRGQTAMQHRWGAAVGVLPLGLHAGGGSRRPGTRTGRRSSGRQPRRDHGERQRWRAGTPRHIDPERSRNMNRWPVIERDNKSAEFFDAAARDELVMKRCDHCGQALAPEAAVCTSCCNTELSWIPTEGVATLVSWTVVHRAPNRAYSD